MRAATTVTSMAERAPRAPVWLIDLVLATTFVASGLSTTATTTGLHQGRDSRAVALVLAGTLPHVVRRRVPLAVFACSTVAIAALFSLGYEGGSLPTVIGVGAYTVGAYRPLREVVVGAAMLNVALVVMTLSDPPGFAGPDLLLSVIGFGAAFLLGWTMQSRRLRLDALEREQGEAARRAAADERLRIAQELHDVVAHSLGVIAVQAGVALHVIDQDPSEARHALEHISASSRASLAEIRGLLGLVRSGEGLGLQPTPRLTDLHRLVDDVAASGLTVELDLDLHRPTDVPAGMELAVYRIVQESLTNAVRHGTSQHATVRVTSHAGGLRVVVTDDGRVHLDPHDSGGHGLVGMRERVAVYGGDLEVGPVASGGFRVVATLPYVEVPAP